MKLFKTGLLVFSFALLAVPASAWTGIEVTEAEGLLRRESYGAPTPVPSYCYWDHEISMGPVFHATNADGDGNTGCTEPWLVHCDADSLVFRGQWPLLDDLYLLDSSYEADLNCTVVLAEESRLSARRLVISGELDTDEHLLTVTDSDGLVMEVLGVGGPDENQILLPAGTYAVQLYVHAYKDRIYGYPIEPYFGEVVLSWEDPGTVMVDPVPWGWLKSSYRQ